MNILREFGYPIYFEQPTKLLKITENGIVFSDGTQISHYHNRDCCENVYAEWEALKDQNIFIEEFTQLEIMGNSELGIILNSYVVPCYNENNGYYSSDLAIIITRPDLSTEILDISAHTKDIQ